MPEINDAHDNSGVADLPLWADADAHACLLAILAKYRVPYDVLTDLVREQRDRQDQIRARGINQAFETIIGRMDD